MIMVNTHEAKTRFSALLAAVEKGHETVLVCRNGRPVAELHAIPGKRRKKLPPADRHSAAVLRADPTEPDPDCTA